MTVHSIRYSSVELYSKSKAYINSEVKTSELCLNSSINEISAGK
jgi:hypothetical protein